MSAYYNSKHGVVSRPPYELFMAFTDMRNFRQMLPEDKRDSVNATFDTIEATVNGFKIGVKVVERVPYSKLELEDDNAPFHFGLTVHFDEAPEGRTDFSIDLRADLNLMMKAMLGGKIKEALDKVVDGLVAVSEGRVPAGMNPSDIPGNFNL
ncbi:MAG: SRPBCC family protein [Bacteroidales bacterium]|nr:SRPBCC family protein [Bacteroidales bacterium]